LPHATDAIKPKVDKTAPDKAGPTGQPKDSNGVPMDE
jgi:hypothetical protein